MTTKQTGHTPIPWRISQAEPESTFKILEKQCIPGVQRLIASMEFHDTINFNEANAAFIVTACNSHEMLLDALRELSGSMQIVLDYVAEYNLKNSHRMDAKFALNKAKKAIAKAEGETR